MKDASFSTKVYVFPSTHTSSSGDVGPLTNDDVVPFRRMFLLMKVFGAWPYHSRTGAVQPCWYGYSIAVVVALIAMFALFGHSITAAITNDSHEHWAQVVTIIVIILVHVQSVGVILSALASRKDVPTFVTWSRIICSKEITNVFPEATARSVMVKIRRYEIFTIMIALLFIVDYIATGIIGPLGILDDAVANNLTQTYKNIADADDSSVTSTIWNVFALFLNMYLVYSATVFTLFILLVCFTGALLFNNITKNIREVVGKNNWRDSRRADHLSRLIDAHCQLSRYIEHCNDIFATPLAVAFFNSTSMMLLIFYSLIKIGTSSLVTLINNINSLIVLNACCISLCYVPALLTRKAHESEFDLYEFLTKEGVTKGERKKAKVMLGRLSACKVALWVSHFFYIEPGVLLTLYSVILTYIIVLLQMTPP